MRISFQILKLFCALLMLNQRLISQDFIKDYDGIPMITYAPHDMGGYQYDYIKNMGIDVVIASNVTTQRLLEIKKRGLRVFPAQLDTTIYEPNYNDIIKYTDARYSIWEAEGTNPENGDATLTYNKSIAEPYFNGNRQEGIVSQENSNEDILITGPGYRQGIFYRSIDINKLIKYQADFRLKIEKANPGIDLNKDDVVCLIRITNSAIKNGKVAEKLIIKEHIVFVEDLLLNEWKDVQLEYDFSIMNQPSQTSVYFPSTSAWANHVDFNVIWKGNPNIRLFVDKITISDERGREIINPENHYKIVDQDSKSFTTDIDDVVAGWYASDEPETIDNYEPIRVVDSILNKISLGKRRLWISFPSSWNGKYGDSNLGAEPLFKWKEFLKRVKNARLQNNHSIFDYPLTEAENPYGGDYRKRNIEIFTDSVLSVIQDDDSLFCLCLQGGRYDRARLYKDPSPKEILYTANLGLMYGAKALSIYRYFGEDNNLKHSGLVNFTTKDGYLFTDKYYFFKDVLSPRLKGELGKTIKHLSQVNQFPGLDLITNQVINLDFIRMIEPIDAKLSDTGIVELGFFKNWNDSQSLYFMMVNRYCSTVSEFKFTLQNLKPNSTYEIIDLIDNTSEKIFTDEEGSGVFEDIITSGDGRLYAIKPI
jgi:hypothetical protein